MNKIFITGSSYFVDKNIKDNLSDDEDASLEIFFGDELDKTEFFSYINSIDLFGSEKYAVLRNAGKIKDLEALVTAIKVARKTNKILWQNIIFSLGIKILVLALGAFGIANMWEAVFADVGVTVIAVINSTRCLK